MQPKLEAQDIRLEYFQPRTNTRLLALGGVNLTVMDGEFVSVVGPSGCGKTTFLSVVDGLIAATSGRILVDGKEVTKPGPDRAVVFQDASLLPWRTVLRNVLYGLECLGVKTREAKERAALHRDGPDSPASSSIIPMSSQAACSSASLARALVMDPKILLMDRPFALARRADPQAMQEELLRIWVKARRPCCSDPYQIDEAIYLSDRVAVFLPAGRDASRKSSRWRSSGRAGVTLKRDARFHAIEDRIWSLIEEDVRADRNRRAVDRSDPNS
jgi:NitT/TauT family transport system ATP-binding protein